jgi:uncharacterized protein YndB with AHSA1/START domain
VSEHVTEAQAIRKSVVVDAPQEKAFHVFTDRIDAWWPLSTHSASRERAETVVLEGRVGGRFYERTKDGEEIPWGEITLWDPPHRLAYTWHPGRGRETAQEVEMRFVPEGGRTRVELEHRGWERLGDEAVEAVRSYDAGWDLVLRKHYAAAVRG